MSTEEEQDPKQSIHEMQQEIDAKIGYLLDNNAKAVVILRNEAKSFEDVARFFATNVNAAIEISGAIAELALATAQLTGDIIVSEFGADEQDDSDDEDDDEEDDDDDTE